MIGNPLFPTYQVFLAVGIAAVLSVLIMPFFIRLMRFEGMGQQIRADGPQTHLTKQGTPTMGGVVVLVSAVIASLLVAQISTDLILTIAVTLATAALGFLDDIQKVFHRRSLGLTPSQKMLGLILISVVFCLCAVNMLDIAPVVIFPGGLEIDLSFASTVISLGETKISIPWLYVVFVFLLMAGLSNAVNLTDGLDGLAGGCVMMVMLFMALVAYRYDDLSLAVFSAAIAGSLVGFLWYNCNPAEIFMGDVGSLALGAAFAALAVLTKTEVIALIMGGLFVIEALSVIIQVIWFKRTGHRVFLMAPIHHHFEKMGWSETKVVVRFWIVSGAFAALGFALYFQLG